MSCAGMDRERGIFDTTDNNVRIKEAMMESAEHTILAVDWQKFNRHALARICGINALELVVTDRRPDALWEQTFAEDQIRMVVASDEKSGCAAFQSAV